MIITYSYGDNLYVNTTNKCDMNCTFCLRNDGDGVGTGSNLWLEREPTRQEILEDILARDLSQFRQIVFCGYGEPTYRIGDILPVCDALKAAGCTNPIRMDTNGHGDLINKKHIAPLLKGRLDVVSVSLNDATAEEYTRRCRPGFGEGSYQAMLDFTRECVAYVPTVMMTVVDNMPAGEIEECRKICESLGAAFRVRAYSKSW